MKSKPKKPTAKVSALKRQLARARSRHAARVQRLNKNHNTPRKARTSKAEFIKALEGTCGIKTRIARNLGVRNATITTLLQRPDWDDVRVEFEEEVQRGIDEAELTIMIAIRDRSDIATASANARWLLSRRRADRYGESNTLTVKNAPGEAFRTMNANLDVSTLPIPIEMKRAMLEAADRVYADQQKVLEQSEAKE